MVGRVKNGDRSRWYNGILSILIPSPSFPCVSLSLAKLPILHSSSQFLRHSCVQMYSLHCITLSFPKPFSAPSRSTSPLSLLYPILHPLFLFIIPVPYRSSSPLPPPFVLLFSLFSLISHSSLHLPFLPLLTPLLDM